MLNLSELLLTCLVKFIVSSNVRPPLVGSYKCGINSDSPRFDISLF